MEVGDNLSPNPEGGRLSCGHYGLADQLDLARWQTARHRMELLESYRLAGQHCFLHPFSCSMVCHREEKTRGGANGVLVAEFSWCTVNAGVFGAQTGFGFYLCLRSNLDPVHPKSHHPSAAQGSAHGLYRLRQELSAAVEFLSELRRAAGGDYFLGLGAAGAAGAAGVMADCGTIPYFLRIGWKSGCVLP